jgi:hypothetical protein
MVLLKFHVKRSVNIGKRNEGGLAVFCRHFLNDGITVEKELNYDIVLVKLKCDFFYIENDMYICFSSVPHEKSNFYALMESNIVKHFCSQNKLPGCWT